jgi:hypothetical protein
MLTSISHGNKSGLVRHTWPSGLLITLTLLLSAAIRAQEPTSLEEAKTLANQTHRLILLEFYRDD